MDGVYQDISYVIRCKRGNKNIVVDALSKRYTLISTLQAQLLGFEILKELYANDLDFEDILEDFFFVPSDKYLIHDGFLYHEGRLYILSCSNRSLLMKKTQIIHSLLFYQIVVDEKNLLWWFNGSFWHC